jgi:hypothetical protein
MKRALWVGISIGMLLVAALRGERGSAAKPDGAFGRVRAVVRNPAGRPIAGALLLILQHTSREAIPEIVPVSDPRGQVGYPRLPVGDYTLRASAPGYAPSIRKVRLVAGQERRLTFVLKPAPR